jgi:ornithine carbamoyltransferase
MNKDLLTIHEMSADDVLHILDRSAWLKKAQKDGVVHHPLRGKSLGMIFEKSSTRTRVSFEVGMYQLGGQALFLSSQDLQMGRGEPVADTARTLSRYLDGIMIRTFAQKTVVELAQHASIPVINGLTDLHHPCQALADLFTIREKRGTLKGLRFCYVGDGNNMAHSLIEACVKVGMHVSLACPPGYEPDAGIMREAKLTASGTGAELLLSNDPKKAATKADILYTDVWASMGQSTPTASRPLPATRSTRN